MFVSVVENYGPLHPGRNYLCVEEKNDWAKIKHQGKLIFVPQDLIDNEIVEGRQSYRYQTYQEIVNEDFGLEEEYEDEE